MKTVRFTEVIKESGQPEVYLLLSKDDPTFNNALHQDRILSLIGGVDGAKTEYGVVGYDATRHGQLLLFPRSLKSFADARIVGIKPDLFSEPTATALPRKEKKAKPAPRHSHQVHDEPTPAKREKAKVVPERSKKVIPFPKTKPASAPAELSLDQLKAKARQALRALEKNNSVAAYKLLQQIVS